MRRPDVRALLASPLVTRRTRDVLFRRLMAPLPRASQFLSEAEFTTLVEIARLVLPAVDGLDPRWSAFEIDRRLAAGETDGWRYDEMPPDEAAVPTGLRHLASTGGSTEERLAALATGEDGWPFSSRRWFEEIRAELVEAFVSHPIASEWMAYVGFADAGGWLKVGLDDREEWEPGEAVQLPFWREGHPFRDIDEFGEPVAAPPPASPTRDWGDECDVVIIGTGAGGAPVAARLCQAGLRVVALEAGRHWDPATEFSTDERDQRRLFWNEERLSAGGNPIGFGANNSGTGVGGSTLHWTAYTPPLLPQDLRLATEFGVGRDWPIPYDELAPYLREARAAIGTSGPLEDDLLPPLLMNAAAKLMRRGCDALEIPWTRASNAALSRAQNGRPRCTNRGFCQAGCTTGAKGSMDVTFIPLAIRHELDLRPDSLATEIEHDGRQVTGVVYERDGARQRVRCRAVFLCAGAIETPRLLLEQGIANSSGQVGRNFLAHGSLQIWGTFEEETRPWKGIPGGLLSQAFARPADADFAGGYLLQSIGAMPVTYASQVAREPGLWGPPLAENLLNYNHVAGINMHGDCLPHPDNYLELSGEQDARGRRKPRIHFTRQANEVQMAAHGEATMRRIWEAAGAVKIWRYPREAHTLGTTRMGADPADSVVDRELRCHDFDNLYICDNGVFPSATSSNPGVTQIALSLRAADRFLAGR